jgi:hypothetical protein
VIYYRPPDQDLTAEEREGDGLTGLDSSDEFLARAALEVDDGNDADALGDVGGLNEMRRGSVSAIP